jgi:two-component system nitrogen regulation response regulator NtrX
VLTVCRNALKLESLRRENRELRAAGSQTDRLLGESPEMKRVKELIEQSAKTDSTILVTGENGTGKELVAREVHNASRRSKRPFVEVNCAAIPDNLIESELFGHEKGAFTHAISQRRGKFEAAHRGTLFLDEVADMSLSAQAKVLRVIQELTFERIGGNETITVDVRLIAATNKDIQAEIADGNFREDLYYRLNVIPIEVAPLRERPEDIALLVGHFMERFKQDPEAEPKTLTDEALDYLKEYPWQGNVRELKNFVERVNIMTDEPVVTPDLCEYYLGGRRGDSEDSVVAEFQEMGLNDARDEFERRLLVHKLQQHSFNITKTAQSLGIYPSNLHGKIKKFGIEVEK